jgi:hypothetical protein
MNKPVKKAAAKPVAKAGYPVEKLVLPADLKDVKPGRLDPGLLVWAAMRDAALKSGLKNFKPTSEGDTYRTYESQLAAFNTRYSLTPTTFGTRTFDGKTYYKKAANLADLAAPGSSNHNFGLAVDISEASGARLEWLIANEHLYGFSHELQSEPWHIRLVCGDRIPKAVLDYELDQALPEIVKPN